MQPKTAFWAVGVSIPDCCLRYPTVLKMITLYKIFVKIFYKISDKLAAPLRFELSPTQVTVGHATGLQHGAMVDQL
jgi:hypothetical protein